MIAIVHSIYSQSVHAPARDAGLMDNDAERYCIWLWHSDGYDTKQYSPQMGVDHIPIQDFTMDLVLTLCI